MKKPASALLLLPLLLLGCEDEVARQRSDATSALTAATERYQQIVSLSVPPLTQSADERRDALERLGRDVAGISGVEGPAAGTRALLTSAIHRDLAALDVEAAAAIEDSLYNGRSTVLAMLGAARDLHHDAAGREAVDLSGARTRLDTRQQDLGTLEQEYQQGIDELESPITELNEANEQDRTEAARLQEQANTLRRDATGLEPGDRFFQHEQAVKLDREADQHEYRVAYREIELQNELVPEQELLDARLQDVRSGLEQIEQSRASLEAFAEASRQVAGETRQGVQGLGAEITQRIDQISERMSGELEALYTRAAEALEQALSTASTASRSLSGTDAATARLRETRIQAMRGRALAMRLGGLDQHIRMLERLRGAADALEMPAELQQHLDQARRQRDEIVGQIREAYAGAQSAVAQVNLRDAGGDRAAADQAQTAINDLKESLGQMLALLGEGVEPAAGAAPQETGGAPELPLQVNLPPAEGADEAAAPDGAEGADGAEGEDGAGGAATHAELIQRLTELGDGPESGAAFAALSTASDPAVLPAMVRMGEAMAELDAAIVEQFGEGASIGGAAPTTAMMAGAESPTLVSEDADRAVYELQTAMGPTRFEAVRQDDRWYLDVDALLSKTPGGSRMLVMQAEQMSTIAPQLAERVRAGEFANVTEVMQALGEASQGG